MLNSLRNSLTRRLSSSMMNVMDFFNDPDDDSPKNVDTERISGDHQSAVLAAKQLIQDDYYHPSRTDCLFFLRGGGTESTDMKEEKELTDEESLDPGNETASISESEMPSETLSPKKDEIPLPNLTAGAIVRDIPLPSTMATQGQQLQPTPPQQPSPIPLLQQDVEQSAVKEGEKQGGPWPAAAAAEASQQQWPLSQALEVVQGSFDWSIEDAFHAFARFGDVHSSGDKISLSNLLKWFNQAKVFDRRVKMADCGISFKQIARSKKYITLVEFKRFLSAFAENKKLSLTDLNKKLVQCGPPTLNKAVY